MLRAIATPTVDQGPTCVVWRLVDRNDAYSRFAHEREALPMCANARAEATLQAPDPRARAFP